MSIFDKIFGRPNKMMEKPVMKVTMMGARGVGKTSVLTSMYNNMDSAIAGTNLHIKASDETRAILIKKHENLQAMFGKNTNPSDAVQSGIAGDKTVTTFSFEFGLNVKNIAMDLEIKDFPGEYIRTDSETVKKYIDESNAIIVAVDTPHLMECGGKYNEVKNEVKLITNLFKTSLNKDSGEKLIMFVPLKCEKYYHKHCMDAVGETIKEVYRDLLVFLRDKNNVNGMEGKFACVVAPILTVGEIEFSDFETDEDGTVSEIAVYDRVFPKRAIYVYSKDFASYSPQFCEQPLYYLLTFVSKQYERLKNSIENASWITRFKKMFMVSPEANDLFVEVQKFAMKKKDNEDGYKVYFGRGKI